MGGHIILVDVVAFVLKEEVVHDVLLPGRDLAKCARNDHLGVGLSVNVAVNHGHIGTALVLLGNELGLLLKKKKTKYRIYSNCARAPIKPAL